VRNQVTSTAKDADASAAGNAVAGNALTQLLPRNAVLHGQIARLLVSEEMRQTTHRETSGRLDRRALARMRTGAVDIYTRREEAPGIDTAVMILIDGSSSMNEGRYRVGKSSRMEIAQCAAWHIARAAEAANGKVAITAFHAGDTTVSGSRDPRAALITIIKPWGVRTEDRAAAITAIEGNSTTPLSPAIIECSRMLATVNATRHILLCLTDGECNYKADGVRAACAIAQDYGVEPVGIGINCDQVVAAFPPRYSVNVENLAQLAATGLGVLVAMLEDANPMAAD
jgi:nitric oxide reductase activation protein